MASPRKSPQLSAANERRFIALEKLAEELELMILKVHDSAVAENEKRCKAGAEVADLALDLQKRVHQLELFMQAQIDNKWVDRLGEHERDIKQLHTELQNVESLAKRLT